MAEHPNTFHMVIASVGETRFDGPAVSATFPGEAGEFTVLPHHEPFVTTLKKGTITVRLPAQAGEHVASSEGGAASGGKKFSVDSGVVEISGNRAIVLL
ncbi:MAG: F0F1 ATP synthase subunit epsilon [bacterium]|nr:F0F1 ATP synthase subunit epsilon [bacterium]